MNEVSVCDATIDGRCVGNGAFLLRSHTRRITTRRAANPAPKPNRAIGAAAVDSGRLGQDWHCSGVGEYVAPSAMDTSIRRGPDQLINRHGRATGPSSLKADGSERRRRRIPAGLEHR